MAATQGLVDEIVDDDKAPGAIMAVGVHGRAPVIVTSGVANPGSSRPMTADTEFYIASITKTFVAAVVLQLVAEGKVELDSPLSEYGVDFPDADVITVRQILSHTSGLAPLGGDTGAPDEFSPAWQEKLLADLSHHYTPDEVLAWVSDRPLLFTPGTSTRYSNINTILAAKVVEQLTGQPWAAAVRDRLLTPLGLTATFAASDEPVPMPIAHGVFSLEDSSDLVDTTDFDLTAVVTGLGPAGSIVSNAADLIDWGNALLRNDSVIDGSLAAEAHRIGPGGTGLGVIGFTADGPCVFERSCRPGVEFTGFGGFGSLPGAQTKMVYDVATDTLVVLFVSRSGLGFGRAVVDEFKVIAKAEADAAAEAG